MSELQDMLWIEMRKATRSRMPLFTAVMSLFMPLGIGFLILVATHPGVSDKLGLVGAKANLMAYASTDWPAYLGLLALIVAAGGFLVCLLITSWVFGREFVDGTLKDLLAVPVGRESVLLAKFIVAGAWSAALAVLIFAAGLVVGAAIGLAAGSGAALLHGAVLVAVTAALVIVVETPFAFVASVGRGYLLPIGLALLALLFANLSGLIGLGQYFPWSVPGVYAQGKGLPAVSYAIAVLTGAAGIAATYLWWKYADQSR